MAKLSNTELHYCFAIPLIVVTFLVMLIFTAVAPKDTAAFRERTDTCIAGDDGPGNWYKGYHDAQNDFLGLNGHGYDASTHLKGEQGDIYVAGYRDGWADAQKGVTMPSC